MSYLRADDSLDANPKILALGTDQRRYTWVRILLYSIRFASPEIPPHISETVPKATRTFLKLCEDIGLIDTDEKTGTMRVHDWDEYNGVVAEQREKWKENKRTQRGQAKDRPRTGEGQPRDETTDSRAGARSRVPFPFPSPSTSLSQEDRSSQSERERSENEEDRRQAWLERSSRPDVRSPQAFVAAGIRSGGWPDPYVAASNGSARAIENGSGSGPAYIAGLIRNGVIADLADLETELTLAGVEDDDRSSLVAQLQLAQQLEGRE